MWGGEEKLLITVKIGKKDSYIKFEKENGKGSAKFEPVCDKIKIENKMYFIFAEICNRRGNEISFCE